MEETKCKVCSTYEIFESLQAIDYETEEAFHLAVGHLLQNVLEQAIEQSYEAGLEDGQEIGYKQATADVAEIVGSYAQTVNEKD